ncbi:hypothetical protein BKA65DRAFT_475754 [Rhexocercosporidium sp. MPI-PUGE-AT-0058]|nr:hypothetical protein BKA65DRAFT_475754 [Rhexocercosporidium sp. MPI-PUGE-AT-0058]
MIGCQSRNLHVSLSEDLKKVQSLALHQNELPDCLLADGYIDVILQRFGNVENLTMVIRNPNRDTSNIMFLEISERAVHPWYSNDRNGQALHPALEDVCPGLEDIFLLEGLRSESERIWQQTPYVDIDRPRVKSEISLGGEQMTWKEPHLQFNPVLGFAVF